jgi:hypothetical protein
MANVQHRDPMKTKTGKTRLGPLNIKQLHEILAKESKVKNRSKIQNRIRALEKMGFKLPQEPVADAAAEAV